MGWPIGGEFASTNPLANARGSVALVKVRGDE